MLNHCQGIVSTEQSESKHFDLALETGHMRPFQPMSLSPNFLKLQLNFPYLGVAKDNSTSVIFFISTLQNASYSLRPSSIYFSSRKYSLVKPKGICFLFSELSQHCLILFWCDSYPDYFIFHLSCT